MLKTTRALLGAGLLLASATASSAALLPNTVTFRNYFKSGTDSLTFNRPVVVKPYPGVDSTFIVLQQSGQILTVRWVDGGWRRTDTASVTVLAGTSGSDEQGLLGFAFHPNFAQNGKYYIYFVSGTATDRFDVLAERIAGSSKRPATTDSHRTLFRVSDPYDNHNGGALGFDAEGHLVLAIGDGGTTNGDPENRAQNKMSFFGKFLRFDVNGADAFPSDTTRNYAIPSSNPFKDSTAYLPEIWAYGLRNPWKWSFHPVTNEIWAGDVGQDTYEEISLVPKGSNLGWRLREGPICFNPTTGCPSAGLQPPAKSIHSSQGSSVTGGVFFMGATSSAFHGTYIFGDYGSHRVWAMRVENGVLIDSTVIGSVNKVASFDTDRQGRILATSISSASGFQVTSNNGRVFVLESPDMVLGPTALRNAARPSVRALSRAEILRAPADYEIRRFDGRGVGSSFVGTVLVRKKGSADSFQLMPWVW
jgi:glucose/arabinose dehydrogenase